MNSRERVRRALDFREPDRIPMLDGAWDSTIHRWHGEGLPEDCPLEEYFDFDIRYQNYDGLAQFETEVIEETEEYIIDRSPAGTIRRDWKFRASTPEFIDSVLKDRTSWQAYKERLAPHSGRVDWATALPANRGLRDRGKFLILQSWLDYEYYSNIMGPTTLLLAMAEDPAWVREMFEVITDQALAMAEEMLGQGFHVDGAMGVDDMAYKNGPFFSPAFYREIIMPLHKRFCGFYNARGIPVFLHSDGCLWPILPLLIEAGFRCINPCESRAGMDLLRLKKEYGTQLAFWGGIDAGLMHQDEAVIREEIRSKISIAKRGGGYIYTSDNSVPDDVSFSRYQEIIEWVREAGRREG